MSEPIFRTRRLGHVNFFVDDLARSTAFYNSVCGLALEFVETGLKASFLGTGHTPHDVGCIETTKGQDRRGKDGHLQIPKEVGAKAGLNHLAWEIDNEAELVAGYRRCRAAGLKINRLADHQVAHSIYMHDPDGNTIEFYVDTVKDWRSVLHGELELITTIWDPDAAPPNPEPAYDEAPERHEVAAAPIHPWRLSHAVLASADPARLAAFYRDVAGLRPVSENGAVHVLRGSHDGYGCSLVIVPGNGAQGSGLHHFALELAGPEAVDTGAEALARRNVAIERRLETATKHSLFLRDPDGQRVEFFVATGRKRNGAAAADGALDPDAV
jgi:catechol 2,3-dioxygenase